MSNTITARHVDTCMSSYLQDSYSREGQTLCLTTLGMKADETVDELYQSIDWDAGLPDTVDDDAIKAALRAAIEGVDLRYIDPDGNRQPARMDDFDDEEPYLYVVLEWDATTIKMRLTVDVEYWANGEDAKELEVELKYELEGLVANALGDSSLTSGKATVKTWGATAEPQDITDLRK